MFQARPFKPGPVLHMLLTQSDKVLLLLVHGMPMDALCMLDVVVTRRCTLRRYRSGPGRLRLT
jgi:hypothetical protein